MVTQTLEARGVLNMVRAQLRAAVFTAVDEQEKALGVHTPNPDALRAAASADGALACALVVDFMRSFGMAQSLSVFGPESNLGEEAMAEAAAGGAPLAAKVTKATGLALPAATAGAAEPLLMQLLRAARGGAQTAMPSGTAAPASAAASGGGGSSSSSSSPANTQAAKTSPAASPASGTQRQQHLSPPTPPAGGAGAVEQQGDDTGGSAADEGYGDSDFEDEEEDGEISDALSVSDEILSIDEVSRSFNERSFSEAAAAGGGGMNGSLNASLDGSAALDRTLDRTLDSSRALDSYDFVEPVNTASPKSKR